MSLQPYPTPQDVVPFLTLGKNGSKGLMSILGLLMATSADGVVVASLLKVVWFKTNTAAAAKAMTLAIIREEHSLCVQRQAKKAPSPACVGIFHIV